MYTRAFVVSLLTLLFSGFAFAEISVKAPQKDDFQLTKRVLIVASNLEQIPQSNGLDARNNLWEYAPPYHVFLAHGFEVDFVSPSGGVVPFMMDAIGISRYTIAYEGFTEKTLYSLSPNQVDANRYAAVYVGGGYGNLFDVASNKLLLDIIAKVYSNGGVLGSCGHGAGVFAELKLPNGEYLVQGVKVAGFPDSTEKQKDWADQGRLLPFLVESQLRKRGAIALNKTHLPDKHQVISHQRIVSTMFLPSAALVAKEMLLLLEPSQGHIK